MKSQRVALGALYSIGGRRIALGRLQNLLIEGNNPTVTTTIVANETEK